MTGALASVGSQRAGLSRLVGGNRATLLGLLDDPRSPTGLATLSQLPLGSVGNHLRVLLDASVVLRRRSGREVLDWRTALGDALVAANRSHELPRPWCEKNRT